MRLRLSCCPSAAMTMQALPARDGRFGAALRRNGEGRHAYARMQGALLLLPRHGHPPCLPGHAPCALLQIGFFGGARRGIAVGVRGGRHGGEMRRKQLHGLSSPTASWQAHQFTRPRSSSPTQTDTFRAGTPRACTTRSQTARNTTARTGEGPWPHVPGTHAPLLQGQDLAHRNRPSPAAAPLP